MRAGHSIPSCELCSGRATLYCPSDSAFLCPSCDSHVHLANFLVSRHPRQPLCPDCHSISPCAACPSLPFAEESRRASSPSSSSSACVSTTQSSASRKTVPSGLEEITSRRHSRSRATRQDARADAVFVMWCERMGLERHVGSIVPGASSVLEVCREKLKVLPLRVAAAASFWWAVRRWSGGEGEGRCTWLGGKRLEEVTRVPWKLILAAEAKLRRAARLARRCQLGRIDAREGWAECG